MPPPSPSTPLLPRAGVSLHETLAFAAPHVIPSSPARARQAALSTLATLLYKASLFLPGVSAKVVVDAVTSGAGARAREAWALQGVALYVVGRLGAAFFSTLQEVTYEGLAQEVRRSFGARTYGRVVGMGVGYHCDVPSGRSVDVLNRGVEALALVLRVVVLQLVPTMIEVVVISGIFFGIGSRVVACTTFLSCVCYVWVTRLITKWRVSYQRQIAQAQRSISAKAVETFGSFEAVKTFSTETYEVALYDQLRGELQDASLKNKWLICVFYFGQNAIMGVGLVVGMLLTIRDIIHGRLTTGDFMLIYFYMVKLYAPLVWMGSTWGDVVGALTDLEAVILLYRAPPEDLTDAGKRSLSLHGASGSAAIEFRDVTFRYSEPENPAMRDDIAAHDPAQADPGYRGGVQHVSFRVPRGKTLALVGLSGSGKSTIGRLLLRFYEPSEGRILIDGVPTSEYTLHSLRSAIGVVSQDTILFDDTIRKNISYGNPNADDETVWAAIRMAQLTSFVSSQPEGLDSTTGSRGVRMSGGERQRMGVARCMCKNPGIILLDEATSALDSQTESALQAELRTVFRGRTTVVIAHRLSTIRHADEILVITPRPPGGGSSVAERGTHDALLAHDGLYADMWRAQAQIHA